MKKVLILTFLSLFLVSSVFAMSVKTEVIADVIIPQFNDSAEYVLHIENAVPGEYTLYTLTDVKLEPSESFSMGTSKDLDVEVSSTDYLKARGNYLFSYTLKQRDGEAYNDKILVKIVDFEDSVQISSDEISMDSDKITFYVKNLENTNIEDVKVSFSSILFEGNRTISLKPYEKTYVTFSVDTAQLKRTKAGAYIITADFQTDKGSVETQGNFYLGEKEGISTQEDVTGFLIKTETTTKINVGNTMQDVQVTVNRNFVSRIFTSFNVAPDVTNRDGLYVEYTWNKRIGPAEVFTVKAKTNYILPVLLVVVAIFAILGFRRYTQTKLEISKYVSHIKTKDGKFALRVRLSVKAKRKMDNVSVVDRVPMMVKIYEKFGTLKPDKVDTATRRLQWNLGTLQQGEVRELSYIVYSKVGIVGNLSLPEALGVFEKDGNLHEVQSNRVFFLSDQAKE